MIRRLRNRERGFTLIELLIVVAIIGIIAAILIPNLIDAIQKAKQKRTVSDIRTGITAMMAWVTDQASASAAGRRADDTFDWDARLSDWPWQSVYDTLLPDGSAGTFYYIQKLPEVDAWGGAYEFGISTNYVTTSPKSLFQGGSIVGMRSLGRDETALGGAYTVGTFVGTDYDQDIVFVDGYPVYTPGGVTGALSTP